MGEPVRSAGWEDRGRDASGQWLVRQERPGAVPMTDHRWQGVPAISTCWGGATSAEACNIYAERFHDLREPWTTPAPGEPARRCEEGIA